MSHRPHGSSTSPVAVVLGGIELVRPLALAGIRCEVVTKPKDAARFSRHATTIFTWDWSKPVGHHGDELVARLIRYAELQPEPPILFYEWDEPLLFLSRHREELARAFRFVIADPFLVEALEDKSLFGTLAQERSLPVPATSILTPGSDASATDLSHLGFPLILKPFRRDSRWDVIEETHKMKAVRVDRPEELQKIWPRLAAVAGPILAQRYVEGPESRVESYHVYVDEHGNIAAEFTGRKLRTLPAQCGYSTALTITDAPDVAERGREFVRALDLKGVAKFDFKRGPDGELYLLEVNPRFSLWHHPGARAGVNIPALVYSDLAGHPRPEVHARNGVQWCHPNDFWAAREAGVSPVRWARWALGSEAKAFWSWDDPMPFLSAAARRVVSTAFAGGRGEPTERHYGQGGTSASCSPAPAAGLRPAVRRRR
jgi:predicted ATP-grasp superfamily ATP-dependent carboligase